MRRARCTRATSSCPCGCKPRQLFRCRVGRSAPDIFAPRPVDRAAEAPALRSPRFPRRRPYRCTRQWLPGMGAVTPLAVRSLRAPPAAPATRMARMDVPRGTYLAMEGVRGPFSHAAQTVGPSSGNGGEILGAALGGPPGRRSRARDHCKGSREDRRSEHESTFHVERFRGGGPVAVMPCGGAPCEPAEIPRDCSTWNVGHLRGNAQVSHPEEDAEAIELKYDPIVHAPTESSALMPPGEFQWHVAGVFHVEHSARSEGARLSVPMTTFPVGSVRSGITRSTPLAGRRQTLARRTSVPHLRRAPRPSTQDIPTPANPRRRAELGERREGGGESR